MTLSTSQFKQKLQNHNLQKQKQKQMQFKTTQAKENNNYLD